jgi:membrane-associated protease RseP (regulator of RpoE activity)
MPSSHPDSSDSPTPSGTPSADAAARAAAPAPLAWRTNLWLFAATVGSCFVTTFAEERTWTGALHAAEFTAALLAILLCHEFGHYIAARIHRVDASLPFFIPLPIISPFGTMGAVIRMRSVIPTRRALLDIGASGPLAGLAVAIPLYAWGVAHSKVISTDSSLAGVQLGQSLLLKVIDHYCAPPTPEGTDVLLGPVAWAGWAGMFVTMLNLFPIGQLDAGHVAYALFGPRQNRIAQWVHRSMLVFFFVSLASFVARDVRAGFGLYHLGRHVGNSVAWIVWFELFAIIGTLSSHEERERSLSVTTRVFGTLGLLVIAGMARDERSPVLWITWFGGLGVLLAMEARWGALRKASRVADHPPTGAQPLDAVRAVVAVVTLAFFVLLFMPTPFAM